MMIQTLNISGLKPEQVEQIKAIIEAFKAQNKLDQLASNQSNDKTPDIIDLLTQYPIKVNGFISHEDIYER